MTTRTSEDDKERGSIKITKRTMIDLARAPAGTVYRDCELGGFAARRNGDGSISFTVEGREGGGRRSLVRRMTLGKLGTLTPEDARRLAKDVLVQVASGGKPFTDRTAKRLEMNLAELLDLCMKEHWKVRRKASTVAEFNRLIECVIKPGLGSRKISDITTGVLEDWHRENSHRRRSANQALSVISKSFSFAMHKGLLERNVATKAERFEENDRRRVASSEELRRIWLTLEEADISPSARKAIKLVMLTGSRVGEWLQSRWEEVDLPAKAMRRADTKTGGREFALSQPVIDLLSETPQDRRLGWVLPNPFKQGEALPYFQMFAAWRKVLNRASVENLRIHDLRRGFATSAARAGWSAHALKEALGHSSITMSARYVADAGQAARSLNEAVAREFLSTVGEPFEPKLADVMPMPARKG